MTQLPPQRIMWRKLGHPDCGKREPRMKWTSGPRCGSCMTKDLEASLARRALSDQFGSWDDIRATTDGLRWLCRACAWAYSNLECRRRSFRITARGYTPARWATIAAELSAGPLSSEVAWSIPASTMRVVLPRAQWGMVATDHIVTPWTAAHAQALRSVVAIREAGATEGDLTGDKPLIGFGDTPADQLRTADLWDDLRPWRQRPEWPLLVKVARPSRIGYMEG